MSGILILVLSLIVTFVISKFTSITPTTNYNNKFEYIPIITSNIYADLLIILITFSYALGKTKAWEFLGDWYKKYRLSAMIADIFIGVLYILLARFITYYYKLNLNLFEFTILAVIVQLCLDFLFYLFFSSIPKGKNNMLDLFKGWGKVAGADALWGDSVLVVVAVLLSSLLKDRSFDFNIITLLIGVYLTPYVIYMKD